MSLNYIFILILLVVGFIELVFFPIPLGSDKAKFRRVPFVTLTIVMLNVLIFFSTLNWAEHSEKKLETSHKNLLHFLQTTPSILESETVQKKLNEAGLIPNHQITFEEGIMALPPGNDSEVKQIYGELEFLRLMESFDKFIVDYKSAMKENFYYKYGLGPNGKWKIAQLITHMFLHGGLLHLAGNMLFLLALGSGLEEYWGHKVYSVFYIFVGMAACVPSFVVPYDSPMIGASGAISGVMGGFLICMHNTKIKIGWLCLPFFFIFLILRKKPFGIIRLPAYIYLVYYFFTQMLFWWVAKNVGGSTGVAYSAHVGGFFFGVAFAIVWEAAREARKIYTGKVDEEVAEPVVTLPPTNPAVTNALALLQQGEIAQAEYMLRNYLADNPYDVRGIKALLRVFQRAGDHKQLKDISLWFIEYSLASGDKDNAAQTYRNLLFAINRDDIELRLPAQDWMTLCDSIRKIGMHREASIECEMMALAYPDTMLAMRACVQGGEAALAINDMTRAMRLFEMALAKNMSNAYEERARRGLDACRNASHSATEWAENLT